MRFLKEIPMQDGFGNDLGPILAPQMDRFGGPREVKNGSKIDQKSDQKKDWFLIGKKGESPGTALEKYSEPEPWRG